MEDCYVRVLYWIDEKHQRLIACMLIALTILRSHCYSAPGDFHEATELRRNFVTTFTTVLLGLVALIAQRPIAIKLAR